MGVLPVEERRVLTAKLDEMRRKALEDPESFWDEHARALEWYKIWDKVLDDGEKPFYRWFVGGRINASYNALDRHVKTWRKNKVALIWEGEDGSVKKYSYRDLYVEVNRVAALLKNFGVKKGDRVALYLPMIPELPIFMLAAARIGAPFTVIFSGFSSDSLAKRLNDSGAKLLVTADGFWRRGRVVRLKDIADKSLEQALSVESVLVVRHAGVDVAMQEGRDYWYHEALEGIGRNTYVEPERLDSNHPLFILYTSGTTGTPKGIYHSTGGYLVWVYWTLKWAFNPNDEDIWWCTADIGWITGHSYVVFGPLLHGLTTLMYEGAPDYPAPDRWWSIIERHGVTVFYTSPTAIRMFMRYGSHWVEKHDLSSLRILGSVGEPINPEAWEWYFKVVGKGRCPIIDTWWQTETGGFMISPAAGIELVPLKPGSATLPLPGVDADVVDDNGNPAKPGVQGYLVIKRPWPGMLLGVWGDPERYVKTYWGRFDGYYFPGDYAMKDEDGYFWILGRADEVLKVAAHRIGTMELESALVEHPAVSEAAVVGKPDPVKGEVPVAFVVLKEGFSPSVKLEEELSNHVAEVIGPIARPAAIIFVKKLPKTRSGKIMRRVLKALVRGEASLGDLSTIEDPSAVDEVKAALRIA
ncbi:acetate--CoA ligase [Thermofilum pendens]|uniref:Acetate--CoA ligase n=1 Tax=Thermofilum pendens (strain DSM 2475 / Hrk 5) TaxID=368408 RepID=A1RYL4_THEPD|nr:acetate--CoA ligase [Thermofilum pendens]ABL78294.1 acetate--CoA ligase [Thermofilum pendens Hrk 5]